MKKIYGVYGALFTILAFITVVMAQPTPPPDPWGFNGALFYDQSGITVPSTVSGGNKGVGSLNVGSFYINGVQLNASISGANTVKGNGSNSSGATVDLSMPGCAGATSALIWSAGTGFGCQTFTEFVETIQAGRNIDVGTGSPCTPGNTSTSTTVIVSGCAPSLTQASSRTLLDSDGGFILAWTGANSTVTIPTANTGGFFLYSWATVVLNLSGTGVNIVNGGGSSLLGCATLWIPPNGILSLQVNAAGDYNCNVSAPPHIWGRSIPGTTDTLVLGDCGNGVLYTNGSGVTVTVPQTLPANCSIDLLQGAAGKVTFSAGGSTTFKNPHSWTGTFGNGSKLTLDVISNSGTAPVVAVNGDGS